MAFLSDLRGRLLLLRRASLGGRLRLGLSLRGPSGHLLGGPCLSSRLCRGLRLRLPRHHRLLLRPL